MVRCASLLPELRQRGVEGGEALGEVAIVSAVTGGFEDVPGCPHRCLAVAQFHGIAGPLAEQLQCPTKIVLRRGPLERHTLARDFLERAAIGLDRLFEPCRVAQAKGKGGLRLRSAGP
jgi:hypothetical protein